MRTVVFSALAILLFGGIVLVPQARASVWDQATRFTFSQPVEVPGRTLPAGTYWFQLLDSPGNRNIILVYNAGQTRLCSILLAAPAWRYNTTHRTELRFAERPHDKPEAIMTWFYPGMRFGHELLYPGQEQVRLDRDQMQEMLLPRMGSSHGRPAVIVGHGE